MRQISGFTLIELLVVVALVAVVSTLAVPAMDELIRNTRLSSSVNDFIRATLLARSEAMKRRGIVTVCSSANSVADDPQCNVAANQWAEGWIVFSDPDGDAVVDAGEEVLLQHDALGGTVAIRAANGSAFRKYVSFSRSGRPRSTTGASETGSLVFCDDRGIEGPGQGLSTARGLNVSRTGRAESKRRQADILNMGINCP